MLLQLIWLRNLTYIDKVLIYCNIIPGSCRYSRPSGEYLHGICRQNNWHQITTRWPDTSSSWCQSTSDTNQNAGNECVTLNCITKIQLKLIQMTESQHLSEALTYIYLFRINNMVCPWNWFPHWLSTYLCTCLNVQRSLRKLPFVMLYWCTYQCDTLSENSHPSGFRWKTSL